MQKHGIVISVLALCTAMAVSTVAKAQSKAPKIAFVDLRRALNETEDGKRAMKKLQRQKDQLQKKIDAKEAAIVKLQKSIEEKRSILSQKALEKKMQEYYQAVQELQQDYAKFQQQLAEAEMKATQKILSQLQTLVAELGKKEGYTMIFDRASGAVVWGPSHLDLTDRIIQMYNKRYK